MFSKTFFFLVGGALLAPAVLADPAAAPQQTPPPAAHLLMKRKDDIECSIARYKLETDNRAPPETPSAVLAIADATPTFFNEQGYFNVTDACEGPTGVSGEAGKALTSYMSAASSWSAEFACGLESIYAACTGQERYSSLHLAPEVYCTKLTEEAVKETECPAGAATVRSAGAAALVLAGAVVALVAF